MAKKVRFPLVMDNDVEVRSMGELRDHFSLAKVLSYLKDGKLIIWLRDRYENDIADAIEQIPLDDTDLAKKVSEIFDVPYNEETERNLQKELEREERIAKLKEFTEEKEFEAVIDSIAFDQDEVYDLLDESVKKIYLCGDKFSVPLAKKGVLYIGVNKPVVVIDSKEEVNWEEKQISVENVVFDDKYLMVLDASNSIKEDSYHEIEKGSKKISIGNYSDKTYLNFMIPEDERDSVKRMYQLAKKEIEKLNYDIDADIKNLQRIAIHNRIINLATRYLERL